ncbi:MAG TPA: hypothetical protein VIQ30_04620 [Pseudonocardia sp.]
MPSPITSTTVNPGNPAQRFVPANSVVVNVAEPPVTPGNVNRLPNPDGAYGAYGWTTDMNGHVLFTDALFADPRMLPPSERSAIASGFTGNITVVNATTVQVDPAASPTSALRFPDGMTAVDPLGKYQVKIANVPALVDLDGQPIIFNVKTTPAAGAPATTPWTLELRPSDVTAGLVLTPGTIVPSTNAYMVNFGAHYVVQFFQLDAAETDVRTIVSSARMGCAPGQRINARVQFLGQPRRLDTGAALTTVTRQLWFNYYKADGTFISSQATAVATIAAGVTEHRLEAATAPAGAATFQLNMRLIWPSDTPATTVEHRFSRALVQVGTATTVQPEEFPTFRNIFDTSSTLTIERHAMDSSSIQLVTSDPTYDPAVSTVLRKGARVEGYIALNNLIVPENLERLFTGKIEDVSAVYPRHNGKPAPITTITMSDGMADLAATPRSGGYADLSSLPNVLEGSVVPWNVTGQTGQSSASNTPDWTNQNATALDQVAITRDTHHAYAWLDRFGVFNVHDDGAGGTIDTYTRQFDVDDSNFSGTAEPELSTDAVINTIMITALRQIGDQTEEWRYGPFVDRASADVYGEHLAEFTLGVPAGVAVGATYWDGFVAEVFARNATPRKGYRVLPFSIDGNYNSLSFATVDLGDQVNLTSPDVGFVNEPFRVTDLVHTITARDWLLELETAAPDSVAPPTTQPDLASSRTGWVTFTKVSPAASMVDIVVEYRVNGGLIEWRTSGNLAAAISVPASGDIVNQNVTQAIPTELRPSLANWAWVLSVASNSAYLAITPGGTMTLFAVEGTGTALTIPSGSAFLGQSPAFILP